MPITTIIPFPQALRKGAPKTKQRFTVACSRCSDSRAREKNSRRKKKNEGRTGVQFNALPTDRGALLSERVEQARFALEGGDTLVTTFSLQAQVHLLVAQLEGADLRQTGRLQVQTPIATPVSSPGTFASLARM